jgi:thiamine biosynthesis protein ThiI
VKFVTIPFEAVVTEILAKVDNGHMGVVLKRMMMRAASRVADNLKLPALATGEAVAQVASQTISNLAIIDRAAEHMVLRPLAAMDKQDIIAIARRIGTETFAANMPEYCGVISVNPLTHGERSKTEAAEQAFDFAVLEDALQRSTYQRIDNVLEEIGSGLEDVLLLTTPALTDEIVDIRHPDEAADAPLELANNPVRHIPFYELESRLADLDTSGRQRYLLYCQKGTMSKIHAHHLNQQFKGLFGVFAESS